MQFGWSPWIAIWFAPIAATIAALIIGLPSLRLRGPYVVLLTLAFGELLRNFATQGPKWIAGGGRGLMNVPKFGFVEKWGVATGEVAYYYVALVLFAVATFVIWRIFNSPIGMSFRALRDSETYATSRGVGSVPVQNAVVRAQCVLHRAGRRLLRSTTTGRRPLRP